MFKLLQSKKGLTLIELLVVMLLLTLGFVAMGNMAKVTYRAFSKAEERYIKQEMVKDVANYLQIGTNITAANDCFVVDHTDISSISNYEAYAFLYSQFEYYPDKPEKTGYYLYMMDKDTLQADAECLNEDLPLYIWFEPIVNEDSGKYQAGVIVYLAAVENDFTYTVDAKEKPTNAPQKDEIYYQLDVAYHFPNMVEDRKVVEPLNQNSDDGIATVGIDQVDYYTIMLSIDSLYKGDASNADVSATTFCFIATASYGQDSSEVGLLCDFRDECLLTNPLGTAFVKAYYKLSPPVADFIRESEPLKAAVRVGLKPLIAIATNALDEDAAKQNAPWFIAFMLCGAGATATLIKVDKRRKKLKE